MTRKLELVQVRFSPAGAEETRFAAKDAPDGTVAGWASTDGLDAYTSVIEAGAFEDSIAERGLTGPRGVKLLSDHNWSRVAGVIKALEQKGNRLWIEAQMNLDISYARDQYLAAKMNGGLSFSVGFYIQEGARDHKTGVYHIKKADLIEVSVVAFPANEDAIMTEIKTNSGEVKTISDFEKLIVSLGLVEGRNAARRLTQAVKRHASLFSERSDPALEADPAVTTPPVPADEPDLAELLEMSRSMRATLEAAAGTQRSKP